MQKVSFLVISHGLRGKLRIKMSVQRQLHTASCSRDIDFAVFWPLFGP